MSPTSPTQAAVVFASWGRVADFLRRTWGENDAAPEVTALAEKIAAAEPTRAGQIAGALAFVRENVRTVAGPVSCEQAPAAPTEILRAGEGVALDRAALLWHLLRRLGLPARPVFVGPNLADAAPSPAAFDRVLIEVAGRCHSVDAPEPERDRALENAPLGLTLAPGVFDLEPIAPWQPAPDAPSAPPAPIPAAPPPEPAKQKPVQVEFVLDFASPATARAAEEKAVLLGTPILGEPAPAPPTPESEPTAEVPAPLAPEPQPEPAVDAVPPAQPVQSEPVPPAAAEILEPVANAPTPSAPEAASPLPVEETATEPVLEAVTEKVPSPSPPRRRSLREELEERARAHRASKGDPRTPTTTALTPRAPAERRTKIHLQPIAETDAPERPNPPIQKHSRPNPLPRASSSPPPNYDFDPTVRARRTDRGAQFKVALMVLGLLAVLALWIFVFFAKRTAP